MEMKTIKEIYIELGVSPQAIYKKINKSMKDELSPHIQIIEGKQLIDEDGFNLIKKSMEQPVEQQVVNQLNDDINSFLKEQINLKDKIIETKDKKIDELTKTIVDLTERLAILFENSQQLQKNQQLLEAQNIIHEESVPSEEKKQSFFKRLFKKQ